MEAQKVNSVFILFIIVHVCVGIPVTPQKYLKGQNVGKFVVISDFHYDPNIARSSTPSPSDITFGYDSPLWLINKTIHSLANIIHSDPLSADFILCSGDLVAHSLADISDLTNATNFFDGVLQTLANTFSNAFKNDNQFLSSPIVAIGNNDLYPKYSAPGTTPGWFASFAANWPSLNYNAESKRSFLAGGSYAIDIPINNERNRVRILSLHTNYWSLYNLQTANQSDPGDVFLFLRNELAKAKQEGIKVYILGHIPPGVDEFDQTPMWQERFVPIYTDLVTPYLGNTIMGQIFGHEHVSQFHMMNDETSGDKNNAGPIQYHSSISPYYNNYPSFRIYTYDRDNLQMLDYADWYMNFQVPNPEYQLVFSSALSAYNLASLDNKGYCEFTSNMYQNASLLSSFVHNSLLSPPSLASSCNQTCQESILCQTQFLNIPEYEECMNSKKRERLRCVESYAAKLGKSLWLMGFAALFVLY